MPDLPFAVLLPVGLALVFLVLGLTMAVRRSRRRRDWTRTRGSVVGWRHSLSGGTNVSTPQVAFTTADGREVTAELAYGVDLGIYPTGGEVDVWYDPTDPRRVQANVMGTGCVPHALILLGVAVGGLGVMIATVVL